MDKKIIIIGGGASGFAAASKLLSNGFNNVVILEAENRIGGRVYTIPFGSNVVDMGAQWFVFEFLKNIKNKERIDVCIDCFYQYNYILFVEWNRCHGEDGNVVYEMAKDKNLLSSNIPRYDVFNFVRSNGEIIPENKSQKLAKLASDILNRKDKQREKRAYHGSLGNYFAGR